MGVQGVGITLGIELELRTIALNDLFQLLTQAAEVPLFAPRGIKHPSPNIEAVPLGKSNHSRERRPHSPGGQHLDVDGDDERPKYGEVRFLGRRLNVAAIAG